MVLKQSYFESMTGFKNGFFYFPKSVGTIIHDLFLFRFGSETVKKEFLVPSIAGDRVACLGVSEVGAGSDVASKLNHTLKYTLICLR